MWKVRSAAASAGTSSIRCSWVGTSDTNAGRPASTASTNDACSSSGGSCPATSDRQTTCSPATYDAGSVSSQRPDPPRRRSVARTSTARRERTTRLGRPVEPEVSTISGAGSSGLASQPPTAATTSRVGPDTGRRKSMRRRLAPDDRLASRGRPDGAVDQPLESLLVASPADWLAGSRPRTLPAAVSPVLAGSGVAAYVDSFVWWKALLALVVSLALQVAVNYANDFSDGIRGTDDARVGPMRLVGSGAASPRAVKTAAFLAFGVAGVAGLVLAATTAWWLVAVGLVCVVAAWFYTGGKKPTATSASARSWCSSSSGWSP